MEDLSFENVLIICLTCFGIKNCVLTLIITQSLIHKFSALIDYYLWSLNAQTFVQSSSLNPALAQNGWQPYWKFRNVHVCASRMLNIANIAHWSDKI